MIRLNVATTDLLACTPSSANVLKTLVSYSDKTASSYTGNSEAHSLAAASKATICATPGASTVRDIDHVNITASGGANTVAVLQTISATDYQLISVALASGDTLEWTHAHGWQTLDSSGQLKSVMPGYLPLSGGIVGALTLSSTLTYGGVTLSNAVTGTGNMVLSASPTLTGTLTAAIANFSGAVALNAGGTVASGQTLTLTGATVAGAPTWSSSQAITLSTAAQPNITSLDNLVHLGTGAASTTYELALNGGSDASRGARLGFERASVMKAYIGTSGGLSTTPYDDFVVMVNGGGTEALRFTYATGAATFGSSLSTGSNSITGGAIGINAAPTATSKIHVVGLPTSSAGLASGDVWANSNVLTIVP